jgi:hypothetical protein
VAGLVVFGTGCLGWVIIVCVGADQVSTVQLIPTAVLRTTRAGDQLRHGMI